MAGTLIILESPNKVKQIKEHGYLDHLGIKADLMATAGHILDLPPMREGACVDTTTFLPERVEPKDEGAADRLERLKAAMGNAETVIVATDNDREGEAIAAEIWPFLKPGQGRRAYFEEITEAGIKAGLAAMPPDLKHSLVEAALTRRVIDRLAGWHGTATVQRKIRTHKGSSVSAGRLQSPALRLVVERFREYQAFKSKSSYKIRVKLRNDKGEVISATLVDENGPRVFPTKAEAEKFRLGDKTAAVTKVEAVEKAQKPKPPFEGSTWLQVAQKALGMPVDTATKAIQGLFEAGQTTYPRTDSVRVAEEAITWARQFIAEKFGPEYVPEKPWEHRDPPGAQGAHEAIRPTAPGLQVEGTWAQAFGLIEARFLASQASARRIRVTTADLASGPHHLLVKGTEELFPGWKRILTTDAEEELDSKKPGQDEDDEESLPALAQGDSLEVLDLEVVETKSKPKPLFSQASLVAELKRKGIGRPSTYNACVSLILARGWVRESAPPALDGKKRKKKADDTLQVLIPEPIGMDLSDFLVEAFHSLVDYGFTASLEARLDQIEAGKETRSTVAGDWWAQFAVDLEKAAAGPVRYPERPDLGPCPACAAKGVQARLRLMKGTSTGENPRPYEFAACERPREECGYHQPTKDGKLVAVIPCPTCHKPLKPVTKKDQTHALRCEPCNSWLLADRDFRLVVPPKCPTCKNSMVHRSKTEKPDEFFWACFEHRIFHKSDPFGKVLPASPKTSH